MENKFTSPYIKEVFRLVKPHFIKKLGKYTHKRIDFGWHFQGLAFVRKEMTYVFGFYIGFFKSENEKKYDKVGMNVLIRSNKDNEILRKQYADFFRKNLKNWYYGEDKYSSHRGVGVELERYKKIDSFKNQNEIVKFLEESITELHKVYYIIVKNQNNIFNNVLRASSPWHDSIIDICNECIENQKPI